MPTALPPPTRRIEKKRGPFDTAFNTFMVVSAVALTLLVLVQEQRYAIGQPGPFADALAQLTAPSAPDITGEIEVTPPSD